MHDPRTHLKVALSVLQKDRPDHDVQIHVSVKIDIAQRTGINTALHGLEFVNDLHATDLGAARDRSSGKHGLDHIERVFAFF